jgi:hypothetical protein
MSYIVILMSFTAISPSIGYGLIMIRLFALGSSIVFAHISRGFNSGLLLFGLHGEN